MNIAPLVRVANVLDMFHGDDNEEMPDFARLKAQGFYAVIHKATQGSHYRDPLFAARIKAADAAGLLVGAYHFGDGSPVDTQVSNFLETTQAVPRDFVCLDFENNPKSQMSGIQAAGFLARLDGRGFNPVIYGSDLIRETPVNLFGPGSYLWLAEYGPHENIPPPWDKNTTLLWQFSETGAAAGIRGYVDLNYFDGTRDELAAKWGKPCYPIQTNFKVT